MVLNTAKESPVLQHEGFMQNKFEWSGNPMLTVEAWTFAKQKWQCTKGMHIDDEGFRTAQILPSFPSALSIFSGQISHPFTPPVGGVLHHHRQALGAKVEGLSGAKTKMSTTTAVSLATATPSSTPRSSSKNKLTIIIVATVGGFLFIVALVLIIVPFARRRALRRKNNQAESSSSSDVTSTTVNSRREVHNRTVSADASVPLLEPDFGTSDLEHSRFVTLTTQPGAFTQSSPPPTPSTVSSPLSSHLFAPTFRSFTARPPLFDAEPRIPSRSRFTRSAPQQPLRHTRTRIARVHMDTLPEDLAMDSSPPRGPSPTSTSSGPHVPAPAPPHISSPSPPRASSPTSAPSPPLAPPSPTSWLHIPKAAGIPLISAFRQSISSVASQGSSLPTMQHYPSFNNSQNPGTASTRSSQTFYSVGSGRPTDGHGAPPLPPLPSEHGELPRPPVPRLKPGGGGERVPQVHLNISESHHPASRQASMEYAPNPAMSAVPGSLRPGEKSRPVSSTVGSGSSLSMSAYISALPTQYFSSQIAVIRE
ncbi:hypothetical protein EDB89DRAFT_2233631 [Lactarius sanguifluus]|nr:hypothetical protein EDB89DRAFT_2233631 [Lactarius sanguifluus]